jgi:hypothetical protein
MRPFDSIILLQDLPDAGIKAGTQGAIVETYLQADDVFIVEFFDKEGNTIDVVDVRADQMSVTLPDFASGESIALLDHLPAYKLSRGQVGVIRQRTAVGVYDVEFKDTNGTSYAQVTLHAHQMLLLHWQRIEAEHSS